MVPVDTFSQLFGAEQKLESIRVCYRVDNAGSRIDTTTVYYANESGSRTTLLSDYTNRASTDFTCYTYTDSTPGTINGPVFILFTLYYNGTGSSYDIRIGAITLTLTEN